MWFVWLLRGDVREGASIDDPMAQRDFVSWWLLFGQAEYPNVWWYGAAQVAVAMEPAPGASAAPLPRLLRRLRRARTDLLASFDLNSVESVAAYLCWYRACAPTELPAAPALGKAALDLTEAPSALPYFSGLPRMAVALWARSKELTSIIDLRQPGHARGLLAWYQRTGRSLIPRPIQMPDWPEVKPQIAPCHPRRGEVLHVNLIGFARAEFGIGEDVRTMSRALEAVDIAHRITELHPDGPIRLADSSRKHLVSGSPAGRAINIFCITAFDTALMFLREGLGPFRNGFNVGYWPWELPRFPDAWADVYGLVHEVWAATRFQRDAYRANSPVPVRWLPPSITTPQLLSKSIQRRAPFRFLHPFDPNSTLARKNPLASVRAFRLAFPASDPDAELVLRVNGVGRRYPGWRTLRAAIAGDTRIRVIEGTMSRPAAQQLMLSAGCLVSPHRAEGLGRNIGEAIALGVPVLATGFSGSADLLLHHEYIPARLRPLRRGEYPFGDGQYWAEPNILRLAGQMRRIRTRARRNRTAASVRRAKLLLKRFGTRQAGLRYADALERIRVQSK